MPPPLALALTVLLIGYLLRREVREEPAVSRAVWIPIAWLMINGSRQVSQWFGGGGYLSAQALSEGNAVDKFTYSGLIVAGLVVLVRRRVQLGEIVKNNLAIFVFFLYAGISVVWSDFPLTALKRWSKAVGDLVMVLVLWSDPLPVRAITATIRRCAYVLLPLSLLFCKYYPNLGRVIDDWGKGSYTGVTTDKNMFGYLLFAFGLFFVAALTSGRKRQHGESRVLHPDQIIGVLFLAMIAWLVPIANSKTSTISLVAGIAVIMSLRFATVRKHFWAYALTGIVTITVADELFSVKDAILEASGRDASFTGRTGLWQTVLKEPNNPLVGTGYASFWLGERLTRFWAMYPTSPPIEAHNGYLEVYINLGLIGLVLIIAVLWKGLRTTQSRSAACVNSDDQEFRTLGTFGLAYGAAYLLYNWTEATFQGLNLLFTIFLILGFTYTKRANNRGTLRGRPEVSGRKPELDAKAVLRGGNRRSSR